MIGLCKEIRSFRSPTLCHLLYSDTKLQKELTPPAGLAHGTLVVWYLKTRRDATVTPRAVGRVRAWPSDESVFLQKRIRARN